MLIKFAINSENSIVHNQSNPKLKISTCLRRLRRSWLGCRCPSTSPPSWLRSLAPKRENRYALVFLGSLFTWRLFVGVQAPSDQEAVGVPQGEELAGTLFLLLEILVPCIPLPIPRILRTSSSSLPTRLWREYLGTRGRSVSGCRSTWRSTSSTQTSSSCAGVKSFE